MRLILLFTNANLVIWFHEIDTMFVYIHGKLWRINLFIACHRETNTMHIRLLFLLSFPQCGSVLCGSIFKNDFIFFDRRCTNIYIFLYKFTHLHKSCLILVSSIVFLRKKSLIFFFIFSKKKFSYHCTVSNFAWAIHMKLFFSKRSSFFWNFFLIWVHFLIKTSNFSKLMHSISIVLWRKNAKKITENDTFLIKRSLLFCFECSNLVTAQHSWWFKKKKKIIKIFALR